MAIVYSKEKFIIVECGSKYNKYYTVVNNNKGFKGQHTHVDNFKSAKYVLLHAIKKEIPEDCSSFLKESIRRLIIKNYAEDHKTEKISYETVYAKKYKTFCRKLNKKEKYYKKHNIKIVFVKLEPHDNIGYKAKVIKKSYLNNLHNIELWDHSKNSNKNLWDVIKRE